MNAFGMASSLWTYRLALRLLGDETVASVALHARAQRGRVGLRQADDAQTIDRLTLYLRLVHANRRPVEGRRIFGVEFESSRCWPRLRTWAHRVGRPTQSTSSRRWDRPSPPARPVRPPPPETWSLSPPSPVSWRIRVEAARSRLPRSRPAPSCPFWRPPPAPAIFLKASLANQSSASRAARWRKPRPRPSAWALWAASTLRPREWLRRPLLPPRPGKEFSVPSGLKETVLTGFGSGNCDGAGNGGAAITTTGASTVSLTAGPPEASTGGFGAAGPEGDDDGEASAFRSTGCSSDETTLT